MNLKLVILDMDLRNFILPIIIHFYMVNKTNWESYSVSIANNLCGSCDISSLDKDEAYDWLEKYNKVIDREEYFGDRIQEDK